MSHPAVEIEDRRGATLTIPNRVSARDLGGRVLITDGNERAALAVVRSLGRAGWQCEVCSERRGSLAGASRWASAEHVLPDPKRHPDDFVDAVVQVSSARRPTLVLPISEPSLLALLGHRDRVDAILPFPDLDTFRAICDKSLVLRRATDMGIRIPRQHSIGARQESLPDGLSFPMVLKPHRSIVSLDRGERAKANVRWVRSASELRRALSDYPEGAFPILAQEVISGPGVGVFLLMHDGHALVSFGHRRIREKPPSGGVSVVRRSETVDPQLLDRSVALLNSFGWAGVAMVEYKLDERSGDYVLMEVNGRFWGSLQLAIDAGVDFPRLLVDAALNRPVVPASYRTVYSRWLWGEIDHVIAVLRDPAFSARDRVKAVFGLIRGFGPGYREEVFRWYDPKPFLIETMTWFRQLAS